VVVVVVAGSCMTGRCGAEKWQTSVLDVVSARGSDLGFLPFW
jgi:hypothetical protein